MFVVLVSIEHNLTNFYPSLHIDWFGYKVVNTSDRIKFYLVSNTVLF